MNNSTSYDVLKAFKDFSQNSAGIELPADLIANGKPQPLQLKGDKPPTKSGEYYLNQQTGEGYIKAYGNKQLPFKFKHQKAPETSSKPTIDETRMDIESIAPPVPTGIKHQPLSEEKKTLNPVFTSSLTEFDAIADDTMPQGYNVNAPYDDMDGIPTPFDTITQTDSDTPTHEPVLLDAVCSKAEKQPLAQPPTKPANHSTFKTISLCELLTRKYVTNWLVKGVIELGNLALFFGDSASGKTFYIMDMCFCIAAGILFKGKATKQGNVLYICGEGFSGLQKRFTALYQHYGVMPDNLYLSEQPAAFMDLSSATAVMNKIKDIGNVSLIVIDTFHRNMGGGSEDSAADIAIFLNNIDTFLKPTGAAVAIIHHSGHGAKDRSRGSSSIKAAMDVEYQIVKDQQTNKITVTNTKMKDWQAPPPACFSMKVVNLLDDDNQPLSDEDGELLTSVILEPTDYTHRLSTTRFLL
jgi:hypothetical protein